jgi:methyl-accepting chemotaxis protein
MTDIDGIKVLQQRVEQTRIVIEQTQQSVEETRQVIQQTRELIVRTRQSSQAAARLAAAVDELTELGPDVSQ